MVSAPTWIFTGLYFTLECALAIRPNSWLQFAWMIWTVAALVWCAVLVVLGAVNFRKKAVGNLLSCLMIIATVPVAFRCGDAIGSAIFSYKLDRWNEAAKWVIAHNHPNQSGWIHLPPQYADLADEVSYSNDKTCGVMVDFSWGDGWPIKHIMRRYAPNPAWVDIPQCRQDWTGDMELSRNWYEISD
jgi:hypothetical protein